MKSLKQTLLKFPLVPRVFAGQTGSLSKHFRDEGDEFFAAGRNIEALICYNKSLCHAEQGSLDACETFAKRSEVYFKTQHYEACLVNIQLAKDHGYKGDDAVIHRESWCKQSSHEKSKESTWDVFNLSHPRRQNLPFVADCLELKQNELFGRHIVTSQSLRPGTVIAVEEPFIKFRNLQSMEFFEHQRCFNCLRSKKLNLVPSHSGESKSDFPVKVTKASSNISYGLFASLSQRHRSSEHCVAANDWEPFRMGNHQDVADDAGVSEDLWICQSTWGTYECRYCDSLWLRFQRHGKRSLETKSPQMHNFAVRRTRKVCQRWRRRTFQAVPRSRPERCISRFVRSASDGNLRYESVLDAVLRRT